MSCKSSLVTNYLPEDSLKVSLEKQSLSTNHFSSIHIQMVRVTPGLHHCFFVPFSQILDNIICSQKFMNHMEINDTHFSV